LLRLEQRISKATDNEDMEAVSIHPALRNVTIDVRTLPAGSPAYRAITHSTRRPGQPKLTPLIRGDEFERGLRKIASHDLPEGYLQRAIDDFEAVAVKKHPIDRNAPPRD
jgi:hypothetical protein